MPDHEENYHLSFYNLTDADKEYIRRQEWVQATYDLYHNANDPVYSNTYRVRVTWDHVYDAISLARTVMLERGLFDRAPYAKRYQQEYESQYQMFLSKWMGMTERNGITVEEASTLNARSYVLRFSGITNNSFINKTRDSYTMQPQFFSFLLVISLFLGSASTILILETYRLSFREFGSLRALGFTKSQIFFVNLLESLFVGLGAIPLAIIVSLGAIRIYYWLIEPYRAHVRELYFTITGYIPLQTLAVLCIFLLFAALLGTLFVCFLYCSKSVLSLLRGEGTFSVSFVSKTSPAFEHSPHIGGYVRLYGFRARSSLLRYSAIIAIMLPLPMIYLISGVMILSDLSTPEKIIQGISNAFQIVSVLLTTLCVTYSASRMSARSRAPELAVFRALGADRSAIRRVTYPLATLQGGLILVLAMVVMLAASSANTPTYIDTTAGARAISEILGELLVYTVSAVTFVLPSVYSGLLTFLYGFFRRPILSSLREPE
jgi:ABC-type antimicrobial peptide transport system permease subunit